MVNILDIAPARRDDATDPVLRAANGLEAAVNPAKARVARRAAGANIRNRYIARLPGPVRRPPPAPSPETLKTAVRAKVLRHYAGHYGGTSKGPVINAMSHFNLWYAKALQANYPMQDDTFIAVFAEFVMEVATSGFRSTDDTGTWLQGRRGGLRGMGFSDD